jgi:hypothetical protein
LFPIFYPDRHRIIPPQLIDSIYFNASIRNFFDLDCPIKTVNLKSDMPLVREALERLDRELALARQEKAKLLKLVHGYGSSGAGGEIRIAVQKRLLEITQNGQIRGCVFGENWSKSDDAAWKLLQSHPELKSDSDLGRGNRGITIVLL